MQLVICCHLFCLPVAPYETGGILTTYHIGPIGNARILKELVKPSLRKCECRNTFKCVFFRLEINISMLRRWVGWDLKLTPGLTPRCSQRGWGWPPTAAWDWERRGKKWERDNCLFCHSFARAISRPAKAPLSFSQCKIHSFFATHHSTSIHI